MQRRIDDLDLTEDERARLERLAAYLSPWLLGGAIIAVLIALLASTRTVASTVFSVVAIGGALALQWLDHRKRQATIYERATLRAAGRPVTEPLPAAPRFSCASMLILWVGAGLLIVAWLNNTSVPVGWIAAGVALLIVWFFVSAWPARRRLKRRGASRAAQRR